MDCSSSSPSYIISLIDDMGSEETIELDINTMANLLIEISNNANNIKNVCSVSNFPSGM